MVGGEMLLGNRLLVASPAASVAVLAATGVVGICFGVVSGGKFRAQSRVRWAWVAVGSLTFSLILLYALAIDIIGSPNFATGSRLAQLDLLGDAAQTSFLVCVAVAFTFAVRLPLSFTRWAAIAGIVGLIAGSIGLTALPASTYGTLAKVFDLVQTTLAIGCLLVIVFGERGLASTMRHWVGLATVAILVADLPLPWIPPQYTPTGVGLGEIYVSLAMVLLMVGGFRSIFIDFRELARVNIELGTANREQVATNTRLVKMADEVKQAARARSTFLGMVSHELRTPLNAVSGFAQLLTTNPSIDEKGRRQVAHIQDGAARLSDRIEDILALTSVASGPEAPGTASVDARSLLEPSARLAEPLATSKGLQLEVSFESAAIPAGNEALGRVVAKLVDNAVRFSEQGRISVAGQVVGDRYHVTVRDQGPGIRPEALLHVFESFHQVDMGPRRTFGGLGLGLAVVERLVSAMGGTVDVTSEPGAGSTFVVEVPLLHDPVASTIGPSPRLCAPPLSVP